MIPNDHGRYSVPSSDPGLRLDDDGGVAMSNWVATEPGQPFRLNYRVYLPQSSLREPDRVDGYLPTVRPSPRP